MPKTGATRHQKFLKSEKSKTKLKSKKDLPKGTNITKTNFKVKKIVIKEQLKKHSHTEVLSTRKLNINELLSRLNHFNTNSRTDALNGLKELITTYPEAMEQNLGQLILGVTPLLLNIEKVVRHESLKVLHSILSHINVQNTEPFFDIMSTYLRSAMTHIDSRIQEDSLLFLDLLLQCAPSKVVQDFHKIIPNFLDMISKLRVDSKPGRTLTVNLGSQITSVKWRVKVLHRLEYYLQKFVEYNNVNKRERPLAEASITFDDSKMNHYSLTSPSYTAVCHMSCFSSKHSQDLVIFDEEEKFKDYIDMLMPLLFETWLEVCPKMNSERNIETVISEDAASLLKYTLKVFSLILNIVQYQNKKHQSSKIQNLFSLKYKQQLNQHFLGSFPYVTNIRSKQKKTSNISPFEDDITDPKLVAENLEICYLFIVLNPSVNIKNQNIDIALVLNYIEKMFDQNGKNYIDDRVIMILDTIFATETGWTKNISIMYELFRKIISSYFNTSTCNNFKQKIFTLLCKIALNQKLNYFHTTYEFEMWLKNLPSILLETSITVQTVNILHMFATRNNIVFNSVIKSKLLKIIENLPLIVISDSDNPSNYHKLFSILYWIKVWDLESLNLLENQLLENVYNIDHGKYVLDTLRLRIPVK